MVCVKLFETVMNVVNDQPVTNIDTVERLVSEMTPAELVEFRRWFAQFDAAAWDREIEADAAAGRLDELAERALAAHAAGHTTKL